MNFFGACILLFAGLVTGIPKSISSTAVTGRPLRIIAFIHEPAVQVTKVGRTVRYHCSGHSEADVEVNIKWEKESGQLPSDRSYVNAFGTLIIRDARVTDSGTYVCRVSDGVNNATKKNQPGS